MLAGLALLVVLQLVSSFVVTQLSLSIPAPVLGILLLLLSLWVQGHIPTRLLAAGNAILPLIPLFLIPASVGVIDQAQLLSQDALAIFVALGVSLFISILIIPLIFRQFVRWFGA